MTRFGKSAIAFAAGLVLAAGLCRVAAAPKWAVSNGLEGAVGAKVVCVDASDEGPEVALFASDTGSIRIGTVCVFMRGDKIVGKGVVADCSRNGGAIIPMGDFSAREGDAVYPNLTRN